jgi:hypothetical protein
MYLFLRLLVCLGAVLMLTSCTSVVAHTSSPTVIATLKPTPTPTTPSVVKVAKPWTTGEFQNGIQLYWHYPASDTAVKAEADVMLDYIVSLGANSVAISFPIYTDGIRPTYVYSGSDTPSPEQLSIVIAEARARDLRVTVRPIINEANIVAQDPNGWRGSIEPRNIANWFVSYENFLLPYADISNQFGAQEFVAGTELQSLRGYSAQWTQVISTLGTKFFRTISYASNWNEGVNPAFTTLGVDAYPSINLSDSATTEQLRAALDGWMQQNPSSVRDRLTLQEVGIPARSGVYLHPWYWDVGTGALNQTIQANWFTAMCEAAHDSNVNGIYFWAVDTNVDPRYVNPATEYSGGFVGRLGAQSITSCFNSSTQ